MGRLFPTLLAALIAASAPVLGCSTADLDVLDPRQTADASAETALPDATRESSGQDGGEGGTFGDSSADEGVGCLAIGDPCTIAGECCSLACAPSKQEVGGRVCAAGPVCAPAGGPCMTGADCCDDKCMGPMCAPLPPPPACKPAGEMCMGNPECCSQDCTAGHCALLEGCRVQGEVCTSSDECCTSLCVIDAMSVGHCAPLPPCMRNDHKMCVHQLGEICGPADDCCSGFCEIGPNGVRRCAGIGGCSGQCARCESNGDCCSGSCMTQPDGTGLCQPASCGEDGELCGGNPDCCGGSMCITEPPPTGVLRCQAPPGDAACLSAAQTCARPEECCGDRCVPGTTGTLACTPSCVQREGSCTTDGDCCSGLVCLVVYGASRCEPTLP